MFCLIIFWGLIDSKNNKQKWVYQLKALSQEQWLILRLIHTSCVWCMQLRQKCRKKEKFLSLQKCNSLPQLHKSKRAHVSRSIRIASVKYNSSWELSSNFMAILVVSRCPCFKLVLSHQRLLWHNYWIDLRSLVGQTRQESPQRSPPRKC